MTDAATADKAYWTAEAARPEVDEPFGGVARRFWGAEANADCDHEAHTPEWYRVFRLTHEGLVDDNAYEEN